MIYKPGQALVRFFVSQFYRDFRVRGDKVEEQGPVLFVCNHPNFLIDSLIAVSAVDRELWFIAKATLFSNPLIAKILTGLHVIPISRKQDSPEESVNNVEAFRAVIDNLKENRAVLIFPEGTSIGERKLSPIKTGASRMALQAEAQGLWTLGVKVQPLGITYTDIDQFRSSVTVTFARSIKVQRYEDRYEENEKDAVRELTAKIEEALKDVTVEVDAAEHELLVEKIAKIFQSRGSELSDTERLALVAKNVEALGPKFPEQKALFEKRINEYLQLAERFKLDGSGSLEVKEDYLFLFFAAPFVLLGTILFYLPYQMVDKLAHRASTHPVMLGTLKLSIGAMVFSVWLLLIFVASWYFCCSFFFSLFFLFFAAYCGFATNNYYTALRILLLSALWPGKRSPIRILLEMRDELIDQLEALRVE